MGAFEIRSTVLGTVAVGVLLAPLGAIATEEELQKLQDRAAIEALVVRYATALDTLDAESYASVFAEDAEFEVGGTLYRGRAEIKAIVTRLSEARAARVANGEPTVDLYHVISNTAIDVVDEDDATHQSYYQTVRAGPGNPVVIGTMGRYEDVLVKRGGQWFIQSRRAVNFTR